MTKDLTEGSPVRLIVGFTVPLLIGNLFQQFYSMADTLIVGRTLGRNALAAVGCTGALSFLLLGFCMGLTSGFAVITAQRFGAGDEAGVRRSFSAGLLLTGIFSVVLTLVSVPVIGPVLRLIRTPEEIYIDAFRYIVIVFAGLGAAMYFNFYSNIIRALGDSRTPLYLLALACLINIVLDFVLILFAGWGVSGAAVATVAAQAVAAVACRVYIRVRLPLLRPHRGERRPPLHILKQHLFLGFPMGFQMSVIAVGQVVLQFALNGLGAVAVAAYSAAQKIDALAIQPMMSFGITMATYAAQNYGAGRIDRIRAGVNRCILVSGSFSVVIAVVNILAGRQMTALFVGSGETELIRLSWVYLVSNGIFYFLLALLFIYRSTLQGLGDGIATTVAGVMELLMRMAAALVMAGLFGFLGASLSNPMAWAGALLPLMISYYRLIGKLSKQSGGNGKKGNCV